MHPNSVVLSDYTLLYASQQRQLVTCGAPIQPCTARRGSVSVSACPAMQCATTCSGPGTEPCIGPVQPHPSFPDSSLQGTFAATCRGRAVWNMCNRNSSGLLTCSAWLGAPPHHDELCHPDDAQCGESGTTPATDTLERVQMPTTLADLLRSESVAAAQQARVLADELRRCRGEGEGDESDLLSCTVQEMMDTLTTRRLQVPDQGNELSAIDAVLMPLVELHRVFALQQPFEDQLQHTEADLLVYGVTEVDLAETAQELGCTHLAEPCDLPPDRGLVVGGKDRLLVVRTVKIRNVARSVTFIVDTGSPATFVCHGTLRAFGIDPAGIVQPSVRGGILSGQGSENVLDLVIFDSDGPYNDINVLGMDYMMRCDVGIQVRSKLREATFVTMQ